MVGQQGDNSRRNVGEVFDSGKKPPVIFPKGYAWNLIPRVPFCGKVLQVSMVADHHQQGVVEIEASEDASQELVKVLQHLDGKIHFLTMPGMVCQPKLKKSEIVILGNIRQVVARFLRRDWANIFVAKVGPFFSCKFSRNGKIFFQLFYGKQRNASHHAGQGRHRKATGGRMSIVEKSLRKSIRKND